MARMWLPDTPTNASVTFTPATRSAAATDCLIAWVVRSRFTTAPRFMPSLGTVPSPMMSTAPSAPISPMTVVILVVPMSSPTMIKLSFIPGRSPPKGKC